MGKGRIVEVASRKDIFFIMLLKQDLMGNEKKTVIEDTCVPLRKDPSQCLCSFP